MKKQITPREALLTEAIKITTADRNKQYGNPEDSFRVIAGFCSTYLTAAQDCDIVLSPSDVAQMMILFKSARLATNPTHRDSILDQAGYAACAADCIPSA